MKLYIQNLKDQLAQWEGIWGGKENVFYLVVSPLLTRQSPVGSHSHSRHTPMALQKLYLSMFYVRENG